MNEGDRSRYKDFFRHIYLFNDLGNEEFDLLVNEFEPIQYEKDQIIFNQGVEGDYFYIIFSGQVRIIHSGPRGNQDWGVLGSGEYFGEEALILKRPQSATTTSLEQSILLRISFQEFENLLQAHHGIKSILQATSESRVLARRVKFEWLGDEEVIYLVTRKHEFFLYRSLILPILVGLSAIPIFIFGSMSTSPFLSTAGLSLSAFLVAAGVLWGIWNWVDWGNDYYIVTNKRVLWLERVVGLYYSRREAPLTAILAVNIASSQTGRVLNYGNVDVRTFTGSIMMRNMPRPDFFSSYIKGHQDIARLHLKTEELKAMEDALRKRFGLTNDTTVASNLKISGTLEVPAQKGSKLASFWEWLDTFFKVRYEQGGIITYRKHWLVLLRRTAYPSLTFLFLLALSSFLIIRAISEEIFLFSSKAWLVLMIPLWGGCLLWWIYDYLDWSNDIYRLTPEQILDIEKKPLGREDKKSASLDSILSIEHQRIGIIQLLFNFGTVTINVGQTQFNFFGVYNPDQVHQDISDYMEARIRKKREAEASRDRERMADWLKTYHDQVEPINGSKKEINPDDFSG